MKKMIILIALSLLAAPLFAGLITDSAMEGPLVDLATVGDFDDLFEYAERTGNYETWLHGGNVTESGVNPDSIRIDSSGDRGFGMVLHDQGATTGSAWELTADLFDQAGRSDAGDTLTLKVFGMNDPWGSADWKNLVDGRTWATPNEATLLGSIVLDLTPGNMLIPTQGWATFTADVDFGAGYQYVVLAAAGAGAERIDVDNFDIVAVPEPATVGMLGLGALVALMVRRIRA